jgi:hypothetical protein
MAELCEGPMTSRPGVTMDEARLIGTAAAGLSHLAMHTGREISELAAEVHSLIARRWLVPDAEPDARRAPLPYQIVAYGFSALAALAAALPRAAEPAATPDNWRRLVSALNGVIGDKLAAWNNVLAIEIGVRGADGAAVQLAELRAAARRGVVLFVHGLCTSEIEWHTPAHDALVARLEASGYSVAWLRYNSGRAIPENGRDLAALLEAGFRGGDGDGRLVLIGHSMGGLVVRSACHSATVHGQIWLRRLTHAAYLGSPHHGAPLERAGNVLNALIGLSAYSAPLMRLGNIRSRGIKDLRFGCVAPEESAAATDDCLRDCRRSIVPLVPHANHLLVAASLHAPGEERWYGDGLVPVDSALAHHPEDALRLSAPRVQRTHLAPLGHIALMHDQRTCDVLGDWLGLRAG